MYIMQIAAYIYNIFRESTLCCVILCHADSGDNVICKLLSGQAPVVSDVALSSRHAQPTTVL